MERDTQTRQRLIGKVACEDVHPLCQFSCQFHARRLATDNNDSRFRVIGHVLNDHAAKHAIEDRRLTNVIDKKAMFADTRRIEIIRMTADRQDEDALRNLPA